MRQASDAGERLVMILPNSWPSYHKVAYLINKFRVNCEKLYVSGMDEYATDFYISETIAQDIEPDWDKGY